MELVLVRHAEPEWSRDGMSVDNPPLTERGRLQAKYLADRLAHERFDAVLVSPLTRAHQTAEPVADVMSTDASVEDWLAELGMPDWTGTPSVEIDELFQRAMARPLAEHWDGIAGGERFSDFHSRVIEGLHRTLARMGAAPTEDDSPLWELDEPDLRVLVVAHAGTNATIISHLLGIEPMPWEWERFVMFHASFSVLRPVRIGHGWSFSLFRLGDTEHLPHDMRTR